MEYEFIKDFSENLADTSNKFSMYFNGGNQEVCRFTYTKEENKLNINTIAVPTGHLKKNGCGTAIYQFLFDELAKKNCIVDIIKTSYTSDNAAEYWLQIKNGKSHQEALELTPSGKIVRKLGFVLDLTKTPEPPYLCEDINPVV